MKIYEIGLDAKYATGDIDRNIFWVEQKTAIWNFDGTRLEKVWYPVKYWILDESLEKNEPIGDCVQDIPGDMIVMEQSKISLLSEFWTNAEILPLKFDYGDYKLINICNVVDCVDLEKSKVFRSSKGRILYIKEYSFIKEKLEGHHIFKLNDYSFRIFVDQYFVDCITKHKITGLRFDLVWEG